MLKNIDILAVFTLFSLVSLISASIKLPSDHNYVHKNLVRGDPGRITSLLARRWNPNGVEWVQTTNHQPVEFRPSEMEKVASKNDGIRMLNQRSKKSQKSNALGSQHVIKPYRMLN